MVCASNIVADGLGRRRPNKDSTSVVNMLCERFGVRCHDFEMFRRNPVGKLGTLFKVIDNDDSAKITPACPSDFTTGKGLQLPHHFIFNGIRKDLVIGDENRPSSSIVLCLCKEVGCDPLRLSTISGNDQNLGSP